MKILVYTAEAVMVLMAMLLPFCFLYFIFG